MRNRYFILVLALLFCGVSTGVAADTAVKEDAGVTFRPSKKAKKLGPGEEEISPDARRIFDIAQAAEKRGDKKRAIRAYSTLIRKHPRDTLAAGATYRAAQLLEERRDFIKAAGAYRLLVERYPASPNFENAIEAQFRIGETYLNGKRLKILGIPVVASMDRAVDIFAAIVRTAPYGKYTARAQFDIGLARQKQGAPEAALAAYQAVIDKYPNEPIAADAQYQIGYLYYENLQQGSHDSAAAAKAKTGFEDFLFRYPNNEKAATAQENLKRLEKRTTTNAEKIAQYYDKRKMYRAAVIYYNEVIREQPGSIASEQARKRIDQIRAKVGEKALQPAIAVNEPKKGQVAGGSGSAKPQFRGDSDVAPLPPPEQDASLPPPASLASPPTTAPEPSPTPMPAPSDASPTPTPEAAAPTPEPSASPEPTATPAGP